MSTKAEQAIAFHDQGYNCAQAVACSFCEEFGVDREEMFKIAEGFGFGMGIMDMCGALSGMMMVKPKPTSTNLQSRTAPISAVTSKA